MTRKISKTKKAEKPNMGEEEEKKEEEGEEETKPMSVGDPMPPSK